MMKEQPTLADFHWTPQPRAGALVHKLVGKLLACDPVAAGLAQRMKDETGTRFIDWIDHIRLAIDDSLRRELADAGYVLEAASDGTPHYTQSKGLFPPIVPDKGMTIAIKVESITDFAAANGLPLDTHDAALSPLRRLSVSDGLMAIERHGFRGYKPPKHLPGFTETYLKHLEQFRVRRRDFDNDDAGFAELDRLVDAAIAGAGADVACDLFFCAEREFWQRRNRAAQAQKARQDKLGLGWGNHDHHTYRCSRANFAKLVSLFEKLGFNCRERFYAGSEAGWGAQVMEQPTTGIITFNDVDLTPDELIADFAHNPLAPQAKLGTVGLWCALHGDSLLQAGMHHLEAQFDFDALRAQLQTEHGVKTMKPFTNFKYLRQAFTDGERWKVSETRIARVLAAGQITPEQAAQFRAEGALGSHLENLERNDGFKGFNQTGVSEIITATDPRRQPAHSSI